MSRLCVKNIPKYVDEKRLKEFFSRKGEVTDAKVIRTGDNKKKSRQFAFIGFRTEAEAVEALRFFNNSYMDTCKITCEVARKLGDPDIPRPWSKHSINKKARGDATPVGPSFKAQETSKGISTTLKASSDSDIQLQEFIQVMQPRVNSKLWANDTIGTSFAVDKDIKLSKYNKQQSSAREADVQNHVNEDDKVSPEDGSVEDSPRKLLKATKDDRISDMDYFKSKVKTNWSDSENSDNENSDGEGVDAEDDHVTHVEVVHDQRERVNEDGGSEDLMINYEKPSSAYNDENEQALDTGRLFVHNLPYTTNEDELLEFFSKCGDVSSVHLVVDRDTKRSKGICYVLYTLPESAVRALEELNNSIFQGRLLHILPAKPQIVSTYKPESDIANRQGVKTFKQKREQQRKSSEVTGDTKSWNSLFMHPDTVVENIARKYGISKGNLLDRDADDLAVRIALGETHVIAETKKALSSSGVNVAALEELASKQEKGKRSNHVILVKNLPYGCSEGELAKMFGQFGSLEKIILPPTKAMALVIFLEASEAGKAFRGLAYKRYKDSPLYLEWAPNDILSPNATLGMDEVKNVVGEKEAKRVLLDQTVEGVSEVDLDPDRVESRSVFVKNLNFKTSDELLKKHFTDNVKKGRTLSAKIQKHLKNGKNLSMGYGFIEFDCVETATDVCRDLQGTILDGHALILQLCHLKDDSVVKKADKDMSSTKLMVRNVAFEATVKDLRQLFSPFGQLKSVRLPMNFSNHRGYAFVEYMTKQEAQNAFKALSSTHLYGRHLVIERAKDGESLDELRKRTAAQFSGDQNAVQKLSKKRKHMASLMDEGNTKFEKIIN